jgi:CDP-glucose 4,6-dehydratase
VDDLGLRASSFWSERSVLVTGAAGLLGGWLCRALSAAGARVTGLDIDWPRTTVLESDLAVDRVDGDVRDRGQLEEVLAEREIDLLVHLAAQTIVGRANNDPVDTFEHNILGTWVVLEACRGRPQIESVVVASSDKAYGDHGGAPYVESGPLLARHPYAASKTCTDVLAQTYAESYRLPVAITRCANIFGGGDTQWDRIVPGTIRSLLREERPIVRSDGRFVRDFLYVEDAADGVALLAEALATRPELAGEAFNFAAESHLTVLELVSRICSLVGTSLEPDVRNEAVNEIREQRVSAEKAHQLLGWRAAHSLDDGLRLTIDWYRGHLAPAPR